MSRRVAQWSLIVLGVGVGIVLPALVPARASAQEPPRGQRKVVKTDEQWSKLLTREQFMVTRRKATEPAFSGKYWNNHAKGTYACVCCGNDLFTSQAKFESGTGWPSFFQPVDAKRLETAADYELAEPRVEVMCRDCGAHLGHVFNDGPAPTGLRYCMNSASLKFKPLATGAAATSSKKSTRGAAKGKAKGADPKADSPPAEPTKETEKKAPPTEEKSPN